MLSSKINWSAFQVGCLGIIIFSYRTGKKKNFFWKNEGFTLEKYSSLKSIQKFSTSSYSGVHILKKDFEKLERIFKKNLKTTKGLVKMVYNKKPKEQDLFSFLKKENWKATWLQYTSTFTKRRENTRYYSNLIEKSILWTITGSWS